MADPTLQTFCCVQTNMTRPGADAMIRFRSGPYNAVCIAFSICGVLGAIYQILPRESYQTNVRKPTNSSIRGRYIIMWLATADLLASSAVLIRSVSWLIGKTIVMSASLDTYFCAVSSAWIQYFYTATCIWTLVYAVDVFKVVNDDIGMPKLYHSVAWGLPAILCFVGLTILYYPDMNCHSTGSSAFARILPNYFFTYLPIIIVMIVNPILYWRTSIKAEEMVVSVSGRFTHNERRHLRNLKLKFFCINFVFYICWLPNIINAILLWTMWNDLPRNFVLFDWYIMAIMNPLQALMNALVYRKWGDTKSYVVFPWTTGSFRFKKAFQSNDPGETNYILDSESPSPTNGTSGLEESTKSIMTFPGYGTL